MEKVQNEQNTEMTSTNVDNIKFPSSENEFLYGFAESVFIPHVCVKLQLCIFFKEVNSCPSL